MADELAALDNFIDEFALTSYCEALMQILVGGAMATVVDMCTSNNAQIAGEEGLQAEVANVNAPALGVAVVDQNRICLAGGPPQQEDDDNEHEEFLSWGSDDEEDIGVSEPGDVGDLETEESREETESATIHGDKEAVVQNESEQENQEQPSFESDDEDDGLDRSSESQPATPPRRPRNDKDTPEKTHESVWPENYVPGDDSSDDCFECHEYCNESEC